MSELLTLGMTFNIEGATREMDGAGTAPITKERYGLGVWQFRDECTR